MLARTYPREMQVAALTWTPVGLPEDETRSQHARHALDELAQECQEAFPDVPVTTRVREGDAATGLSDMANEFDAELVVVGGPHSGVVSRTLLGATTDHLLKTIAHPIVVVPDGRQAAGGAASVLVGVDGDEPDHEVVEFALDFANRRGCRVQAVHGGTRAAESAGQRCERTLAPALARHEAVAVHTDVVTEPPADALVARSADACLLVVGNHHHRALRRAVRGSVCHAALHHARCPVAIVPGPM
jgi:nucleotide-binding universal stress UspA family protein